MINFLYLSHVKHFKGVEPIKLSRWKIVFIDDYFVKIGQQMRSLWRSKKNKIEKSRELDKKGILNQIVKALA